MKIGGKGRAGVYQEAESGKGLKERLQAGR